MAPPTKQEMIDAAIAAYESGEWSEWLTWLGERRVVVRTSRPYLVTRLFNLANATMGSTGSATRVTIDAAPRVAVTDARKLA